MPIILVVIVVCVRNKIRPITNVAVDSICFTLYFLPILSRSFILIVRNLIEDP
ncbi:hypothetical protein FC56_GL001372 [Lentilactobacillus senioris DSM 24302 = JCM 17472]|uniref:Uncharacterized protein n=1 Tax=Lentilactobacillus senioris DSM 24302 = JCM 17472 TaxID=1423802 RepID=A0A0R2CRJ2_9LACO|nr:hypothetical protein FC56_GL001372 [Lentilactobacillus senioris DSM 24302 = JCM 17472]